jgi:hypothetical protein
MSVKQFALVLVLFLGMTLTGFSQPVGNQPPDPAADPDGVPITGIEFLLTGGAAYGISRFLKNRKKIKEE